MKQIPHENFDGESMFDIKRERINQYFTLLNDTTSVGNSQKIFLLMKKLYENPNMEVQTDQIKEDIENIPDYEKMIFDKWINLYRFIIKKIDSIVNKNKTISINMLMDNLYELE